MFLKSIMRVSTGAGVPARVGIPRSSSFLMCHAGNPAVGDVLNAVDVPGVSAVASVSDDGAAPAAVEVSAAICVSSISGCCWRPCDCWRPCSCWSPAIADVPEVRRFWRPC